MSERAVKRVIIVGGGYGGWSLARFLQVQGVESVVMERRRENEVDRGGFVGLGIWLTALRCLERGGITLAQLESAGKGGRYMLESGFTDVKGRMLAQPGTPLKRGQLLFTRQQDWLSVLKSSTVQSSGARTPGAKVTHMAGRAVASFTEEPDGVCAKLEGGDEVDGDVLVGADGMFSSVRAQLLSSHAKPDYRGYWVYRGVVPRTVQDVSFQTWGPGARFASVPLKDGQVWYATVKRPSPLTEDTASAFVTTGPPLTEDPRPELLSVFGSWHAPLRTMIEETPAEHILCDYAYAHTTFRGFSTDRCTLVGDAAHGIDPILAQGAGVAIEDAYELAAQLGRVNQGYHSLKHALRAYESATAPRAEILSAVSDVTQWLGQVESGVGRRVRDALFHMAPQAVKGPLFDAMIRLNLEREWSRALWPLWSKGSRDGLGYPLEHDLVRLSDGSADR